MAINWSQVAATAAVSTVVGSRVQRVLEDSDSDGTAENGSTDTETTVTDGGGSPDHHEATEELVHIQRTNNPPPESVDAWVGRSVDIPAGGTATVEVTPSRGFNLRVDKVYWDRRSDTDYQFTVGGVQISENHQADFSRPRKVKYGGKVYTEATNNQTSEITADFELTAWAIPSEAGDH